MKITINTNEILLCDPCYIKSIKDRTGETRFDALKLIASKDLHEDGMHYMMLLSGEDFVVSPVLLESDSARIWALQAEFTCEVELDGDFEVYSGVEFKNEPNIKAIEIVE